MKHIFIVLVLPTKSVFKQFRKHSYTTYIDYHGDPIWSWGPWATARCAHALRRHCVGLFNTILYMKKVEFKKSKRCTTP